MKTILVLMAALALTVAFAATPSLAATDSDPPVLVSVLELAPDVAVLEGHKGYDLTGESDTQKTVALSNEAYSVQDSMIVRDIDVASFYKETRGHYAEEVSSFGSKPKRGASSHDPTALSESSFHRG